MAKKKFSSIIIKTAFVILIIDLLIMFIPVFWFALPLEPILIPAAVSLGLLGMALKIINR